VKDVFPSEKLSLEKLPVKFMLAAMAATTGIAYLRPP